MSGLRKAGHYKSYSDTSALTHYDFSSARRSSERGVPISGPSPNAVPQLDDEIIPEDLLSIFDDGEPADLNIPGDPGGTPTGQGYTFLPSSLTAPAAPPLQGLLPLQSQQSREPIKNGPLAHFHLAPPPPNPTSTRRPRKSLGANALSIARSSTPDDAPATSTTTATTTTSSRSRRTSSGTSALTPEEKRIKRIMANRESAHRSRLKKMNYVADLERQILEATETIEEKKQEIQQQSARRGTLVRTMHERRDQAAALKVQVTKQLSFQEVLLREREGLRIYATHSLAKQRLLLQQQQQQQQQYAQHHMQHQPGHGSALELSSAAAGLQLLGGGGPSAHHAFAPALSRQAPPNDTGLPDSSSSNSCSSAPARGSLGARGVGAGGVGSRPWRTHNPPVSLHTDPAAAVVCHGHVGGVMGGRGMGLGSANGGAVGDGVEAGGGVASSTQPLLSRGGSDDIAQAAALFHGDLGTRPEPREVARGDVPPRTHSLFSSSQQQQQQQQQQQPTQGRLPSSLPMTSLPNWQAAMLANFSASAAAAQPPSSLPMRVQQQQQQHAQPPTPTHHRRNYTWDNSNTMAHAAAAFAAQQFHLLQQPPHHQACDPTSIPDPGSPPAFDAPPSAFLPPSHPFNSLQLGGTAGGGLHSQLPSIPSLGADQLGVPALPSQRRTTTSALEGKAALASRSSSAFGAAPGSGLTPFRPSSLPPDQGLARSPMVTPVVAGLGGMASRHSMEVPAVPRNADGAGLVLGLGPGVPTASVGFGPAQGPTEPCALRGLGGTVSLGSAQGPNGSCAMSGSGGLASGDDPLPPFGDPSLEHMFLDDYQLSPPPPATAAGVVGMGEGLQSCCVGFDAAA